MIATIVPYFLLAILSESPTWQNGLELKFESKIVMILSRANSSVEHHMNVTNELLCRPKHANFIRCNLKHIITEPFEVDMINEDAPHKTLPFQKNVIYDSYFFDLEFDNHGLTKLIVSSDVAKDARLVIAKNIANLLNMQVDVSTIHFDENTDSIKSNRKSNFLLGECPASYQISYNPKSGPTNKRDWTLELMSPLNKLNGREFHIIKRWHTKDCEFQMFYWSQLMMPDQWVDSQLQIRYYIGAIIFEPSQFESYAAVETRRLHEGEDININVSELMSLILEDIRPAEGEWAEIDDPVTVSFQNSENAE